MTNPNMAKPFALYGSPHSLFTYKVALMLRLSGQPFAFRYVSFQKGMQNAPAFRALSRWGQVPVLVHGEDVLCQSCAILEYLADALHCFQAEDAKARQAVREWLYWSVDRLTTPAAICYRDQLAKKQLLPLVREPVVLEYHERRLAATLTVLEEKLKDSEFLVGPITIADIACYADIAYAQLSEVDISPYASVCRWAERIVQLPYFQRPFDLLTMADADIDGPDCSAATANDNVEPSP